MAKISHREGFKAWRQFILDYDPKVKTRKVGLLITTKWCGDLSQAIDRFEGMVKEYEQHSKKMAGYRSTWSITPTG